MKILVVLFISLGFVQAFCESSSVNTASKTPPSTPTANVPKENNMKENNATEAICQLTLDLPNLQQYYHSDKPGRKPLNVIKNDVLKEEISLTKFGEAVKFISKDEAAKNKTAALEFTSIKIADKTANVEFRYAIEGIRGTVELKFTDKWEVVSSNIKES